MKNEFEIFRRNREKDFMFFLLSLVFVVGGYYTLEKKPFMGWLCISFFGFVAAAFLIQFVTNVSYLKLYEEGFEEKTLFHKKNYLWSDIKSFWKVSFRGNESISFNYTNEYIKRNRITSIFSSRTHGRVTSSHTIETDDLLKLMKNYKRRCK
ncbi:MULTISPECIES: STM3941 family protein [Flavobacterium]|uniref:STM3941 family protein n=1 Tax=Flavobacterium jumunjinense TaxID=998845 RepID=A0ABV5GT91_9FLAO|nr:MULTISPECIES: STM3941 family protein [Flavobacterium]